MTTDFPDSLNDQCSLQQTSLPTELMHPSEKTTTDVIAQESIKQFQEAQSNIASKFKEAIAKIKSHDF